MNIYTATEQAFKNGYEKGVTEFCEYIISQLYDLGNVVNESDMRLLLVEFLGKH